MKRDMKRNTKAVWLLVLSVVLSGCAPGQPIDPQPSPKATAVPLASPTETPILSVTPECEKDTASVVLTASADNLNVGDTVKITVTLNNEGCVALGLPQYRLDLQSDSTTSILTPDPPEPVVHYLAVSPGQSGSVEFELTAAAAGQVVLTAAVSYEVHLGYPGPAYWGSAAGGEALEITVTP